jgi:HD-GYP domain-containing protein (c-di-GMP phosphodiesterase class II)
VSSLLALSHAIDARDPYTRGHSERVAALAHAVAGRLGCDARWLGVVRVGGALHDVGKLAVADTILRKPGPLTEAELAEVRAHPEVGARIVSLVPSLRPALPGVLYHHERWDGRGYPTRRRGREIPLEARILAVADSFDAMTSNRPYRAALPAEQALAEVDRCAGSQFDPDIALAFVEIWESGALGITAALVAAAKTVRR